MLKEGAEKESRGWIYKELEFDIEAKKEETNKKLKNNAITQGVQISMFEN